MKIRERINEWLDKRDHKGIITYGQTLDACPDDAYSWNIMLLEEMADGIQYAAKENLRLHKENESLKEENKQLRERLDD